MEMLLKSKLLGVTRSFLALGLSTVRELSKKRIFSSRKLAETLGKAWGKIEKSDGIFNIFHLQRQFFACATRFWASESRAKVRDRKISTGATNAPDSFSKNFFKNFVDRFFRKINDFLTIFRFFSVFRVLSATFPEKNGGGQYEKWRRHCVSFSKHPRTPP